MYRAVPLRVNPRQRTVRSIYKTYVDIVHVRKIDKSKRMTGDNDGDDPTAKEAFNAEFEEGNESASASQQVRVWGASCRARAPRQQTRAHARAADARARPGSSAQPCPRCLFSPASPCLPSRARPLTRSASRRSRRSPSGPICTLPSPSYLPWHALPISPPLVPRVRYDVLSTALAPSVWELDDVKRGVLLQLFGGTHKQLDADSTGNSKRRGEINVLLMGDPGTSKSQLLQYVHKVAPRGIYTSGKGSSAVGLTAYVTKDPETREFVLESGALVLSDRGVCCIDEFDKMSDGARAILHETMEQQTVSVAKAGIICSLNARTCILASANPIDSKYDPARSVVENINLSPTVSMLDHLLFRRRCRC